MIKVQKLTKSFGKYIVLDDLNLSVQKASVYGLLGPNGAGKTTLIKHLTGLYRQDQGIVTIDNQPVYENPEVKAQMVYIPVLSIHWLLLLVFLLGTLWKRWK